MGVVGDSIANRPSVSSSFTVLKKEFQNLHPDDKHLLSIQCVIHTILKSFSIILFFQVRLDKSKCNCKLKTHPLHVPTLLSHSQFRIFILESPLGESWQVLHILDKLHIQCACKFN